MSAMAVDVEIADSALVVSRAVIVDEWATVRRGLQAILASAGIATEAMVGTASEGFAVLSDSVAGVLVLGTMSDQNPRDTVERAVKLGRRVMVLVGLADQADLVALYRAGALAVVPRTASDRELTLALTHVMAGEAYVASALVDSLFSSTRTLRPSSRMRFTLTRREQSVLELLAVGRTNREIAHQLGIGTETVKTHVGNLYSKLDVDTRPSAVRVAICHGLV